MTRRSWPILLALVSCGAPPTLAVQGRAPAAPSPVVTSPAAPVAEPGSSTMVAPSAPTAPVAVPSAPSRPAHGVMYSTRRITWVFDKPSTASRKLGYLSVGVPVALRAPGLTEPSTHCLRGFYAVEPVGYVCAGRDTTLDPDNPAVAAYREAGASDDRAYPFHYALSLGAPMYNKLPDRKTHEKVMMRYPKASRRLGDWARSFLDMDTGEPIRPDSDVPSFLRDGKSSPNSTDGYVRRAAPHASLISYTRAFAYDGNVWVIASDLSVLPADRLVPLRRSEFHGVELGTNDELPLAWACRGERRKLRLDAQGALELGDGSWEPRELIRLTGKTMQYRRARYLESGDGSWIAASNACEARQAERLPEGIGPAGRWIYLSMMEDTLVAYRGHRAVYATLHSPGRGGTHRGKGDVRHYTTPLGAFFVNWKERWATLSPDPGAPESFWISDVPGVQYFAQPYALHGAYWHESFGMPMSAGCPNLPPLDAVWLMDFTDPPLPDGWQAIGPARGQSGTMVVVGP